LSGESEGRVHNFTLAYDRTTNSLIITNEALWGDVRNNETEQQSIQKYYSHYHTQAVFSKAKKITLAKEGDFFKIYV
jgi:hypothetical protein